MDTIPFNKLLLKTAFCCMASDGQMDEKEIAKIKHMYKQSPLFQGFNFEDEMNLLINKLNSRGKEFINYYLDLLKTSSLTEEESLMLLDFAIQTIHSDGIDEYSEIKFFKNIRHRLKITDEKILNIHPEVEYWLEEDIITESFLEKLANQYLESAVLPQFELLSTDSNSLDNSNKI